MKVIPTRLLLIVLIALMLVAVGLPEVLWVTNISDSVTTQIIGISANIVTTIISIIGPAIVLLFFIQPTLARLSLPQENLAELKSKIADEPEKIEPTWNYGQAKLELYFNRNLSQINYIFWLSVGVMVVGFAFILFGISQSFIKASISTASTMVTPTLIGVISGIITEFIGATFLFIYRSTVQQAANHIKALERINSVGMAMKILDTISDGAKELQDQTKAEIVKALLSDASTEVRDHEIAFTPKQNVHSLKKK